MQFDGPDLDKPENDKFASSVGFYKSGENFVCQYGGNWPEKFTDWDAKANDKLKNIVESQFARIRTWVEYGMTAAQVAAVYGVAVDVIKGILRKT